MPSHDYTARQALDLLVGKVNEVNGHLADRMELAVNEGNQIQAMEPLQSRRGRRRRTPRYYRRNVPFTDEEALEVALEVLEAHLIETRLIARAAHGEFFLAGRAALKSRGEVGPDVGSREKDNPKVIEIEMEPETVQFKKQVPNHHLEAAADDDIDSLRAIFDELRTLLEAYIFGLCLRGVRELAVEPVLRGMSDLPNPFIFRGAPGQIHSQYRNYGYASFTLNGSEFEIHAGVEFLGTSKMTHELDVCVLRAEDAQACRVDPNDPPAASLVGGWECKFYDKTLDKYLARAFVGLVDDMGSNIRLSGLCSNRSHPQIKDYLQPQRRPYPHLILTPLDVASESRFVGTLSAELKKMTRA